MVQVTAKPVEFTPEGKQLFKRLPDITEYFASAYFNFDKAVDIASRGLDYARSGEDVIRYGAIGILTDAIYWFKRSESSLIIVADKLRELASDDLIREDLPNYKTLLRKIELARGYVETSIEEISNIANKLREETPSDDKINMLKNLMTEGRGLLARIVDLWREILYMYMFDPPEGIDFGKVGNLVKVVAIGLGGLAIFGIVLSKFR